MDHKFNNPNFPLVKNGNKRKKKQVKSSATLNEVHQPRNITTNSQANTLHGVATVQHYPADNSRPNSE